MCLFLGTNHFGADGGASSQRDDAALRCSSTRNDSGESRSPCRPHADSCVPFADVHRFPEEEFTCTQGGFPFSTYVCLLSKTTGAWFQIGTLHLIEALLLRKDVPAMDSEDLSQVRGRV